MKRPFTGLSTALLAVMLFHPAAQAYPPAPDGLIYGQVKDQYGRPLSNPNAQVVLITPGGVQVVGTVQPGLAVGINYALDVPMDMGITPDPYVPNALTGGASFKLYVVVGTTTNLPIEMVATNLVLGTAGARTRQDLTLGTDANGDGIPDTWELAFLAALGLNIPLSNINPNMDYAHDGRTLMQEYLLGNYPPHPTNTFNVQLVSLEASSVVLGFNTLSGHTYTVLGSTDLKNWTTLDFTIPAQGANAPVQSSYASPDIRTLQIQTVPPSNAPAAQFFKVQYQ